MYEYSWWHNSIKDQYIEMLKAMASQVKLGDPAEPDTGMGPLISAAQRERVLAYIEQGKADGNSLVYGGNIPEGLDRGFFIEPTIFDCPSNSTAIAQEEIFGPVVCVIGFDTEEEAIAIANDSQYGLSGGVFSQDPGRAYRIAMQMRNVAGDHLATHVVPRTRADTVTRVDGRLARPILRAQVSTPRSVTRTDSRRKTLAMSVGTGKATEVAAVADRLARHEKRHGGCGTRVLLCERAGNA